MFFKYKHFLVVILASILLHACNGFEKVKKSNDYNYKLTKANAYYDKKKFALANQLYYDLIPVMKNTKNYEALYYRYAYSFWYMKDYTSASYHFKNFVDLFPASKDAEECEYLSAVALYRMSPKPSLDPTNTMKAQEALQSFINTHPNSKKLDEASKYVDECRQKLEIKEAAAAKMYYDIGQYKAASMAYKTVLRNYPESTNADLYQYMVIRAWYKYAKASVAEKQEERYATAVNAYHELKEGYPKSTYLSDAEIYYTLADNNIKKIRNEHK